MPAKAVRCMLEMDDFTENYRKARQQAGVPLGLTRIGVHTGVAVVGNSAAVSASPIPLRETP